MRIIAQDGSGDFTAIQAAIDALPEDGGRAPRILLIRPGVYRERVVVNKDNVRLVGASREGTVITHSACARDTFPDGTPRGTFLSFTLLVTGDNVSVENLTVRNDAGDGRNVGQAVAVYAAGDRGAWRHCSLIAHQDTLFCGPLMPKVERDIEPRVSHAHCVESVGDCPPTTARQYFEDCLIRGDVDFIFGPYRCGFEGCTLAMNAMGGWYTAANTPKDQPWGLVFHRCRLTGDCPPGEAKLGRPWRAWARTLFIACDMDEAVSPQGFADWEGGAPVTERCGEWGTVGARACTETRNPRQALLTDEDALGVTLAEVLSGWDGWRPDVPGRTWYLCGDSTMASYPPELAPMTGWGQALGSLLPPGEWAENLAANGRSSRSFIEEGRLSDLEPCLRPSDALVVSFSHNDEKDDPARHTSPWEGFPEALTRYVEVARRRGAEPILATPIARRRFDAEGRLLATHGDYPDSIRALAKAEGLRLADLERATMALLEELGDEASKDLYCHVAPGHPNYPEGVTDDSHLHRRGALRVAHLFLALLRGEATAGTTKAVRAESDDLMSAEDANIGYRGV